MKSKKKFLIEVLKTTPIIQIACQKTGVARSTYYRWLKENNGFNEKANQSLQEGKLFINELAKSQVINQIKAGNMTANIFWLKHNDPDFNENKFYLPNYEQRKLMDNVSSFNIKEIYYSIIDNFSKGEINKNVANSLISMISNNYPNLAKASEKEELKEIMKKLRETDEMVRQETRLGLTKE